MANLACKRAVAATLLMVVGNVAYACNGQDWYGPWDFFMDIENGDGVRCPNLFIGTDRSFSQVDNRNTCSVVGANGQMKDAIAVAGNVTVNRACASGISITDSNGVVYQGDGRMSRDGNTVRYMGYDPELGQRFVLELMRRPYR